MRWRAIAIAVLLAGVGLGTATAAGKRTVRVSPASVERGEVLTVTGTGWARSSTVRLLIGPPRSEGTHAGSVRTTSRGTFKRRLRISARADTGPFVLLACRRGCREKATVAFRIIR